MIRKNKKFSKSYVKLLRKDAHLSKKLESLISGGICARKGCFFLKELFSDHYSNYNIDDFHDETGFEVFVNSVRVEAHGPFSAVEVGLTLIKRVLEMWRKKSMSKNELVGILNVNEDGAIVKFYTKRAGQSYLSSQLDDYDSAILEVSSSSIERLIHKPQL